MKKLFALLVAAVLLLGLTACGGGRDNPTTAPDTTPAQTTTAISERVPMPTAAPGIEMTTQVVEMVTDPDFDAQALFQRLEGVWNDEYEYPGFVSFIYRDGKPILYSGVYDGEAGIGTLTDGRENVGGGTVTLYFQYPAVEDWPALIPERTDALQIDLTGIDGGELRIQVTSIWGTRDWHTYTYRCKTLQEAGIRAL